MKRQLTSILLFSALLVGGASTFVSCTDHESDSAYNTSVSLADAIAKQKSDLTNLNEWLGELKKQQPSLEKAIDARIDANWKAMDKGALTELGQYATLDAAIQGSKAYKNLSGKVDSISGQIAAIEKLRVKDSIAAKKFTEELYNRLDSIDGTVQDLQDRYDMAFDFLMNKKLDNIAINATENPVTGYWNAAFLGSQLNLASSFYGTAVQTPKGWGDFEPGDVLGKGGNAGYLYVSLNPTELDPSLVKVELVNSQGEPAKGFELGDIESTDKVLTFGYTRAASKNGFYQIPVIASDPQNDDIALDKGALKEAAQNILAELKDPKGTNLDLTKVAAALYKNNLNNKLQAYTVKASYYLFNPETGELELKHAVAPTYNVAAFAVKPLSFNFGTDNQYLDKLSDWAVENFRLPSLSRQLNKVIDAIKVKEFNVDNQKVEVATILTATDVDVEVKQIDGVHYIVFTHNGTEVGRSKVDASTTVKPVGTPVEVTSGHYQKVYEITAKKEVDIVTTLNQVVEDINGQLQPIKDVLSNAGSKWENVTAKVNPLLKKVASKIGSANKLLQPTILYMDKNNNPNTLSTIGGRLATRFVGLGSTNLYATSWTAELLAPAYLKSVYVVEDGAEVTLADGKTSAKTPFNGTHLIFTAKKSGPYTIVYEAIDYSGVKVKKTFNVNVVAE